MTVAGGAASSPLPRAPVRLRSGQSRRRLRRSTRSQSGPRPPGQRRADPLPGPPELAPVTAPVDAVAAACAPAGGERVSLQSPPGFPEEQSPRASPTRGWGRRLPGGHQAGRARRGRAGGVWGLRKAQCRGPSSRAGARQSSLGRAGQGQGRRAEPLGAGARVGARPLSLPGQRGFSRAREAAQEVEVFSKAVAARRRPPRGQRPRRRLALPRLEAQPPERFQKTVLHGEGAGGEGPGLPS